MTKRLLLVTLSAVALVVMTAGPAAAGKESTEELLAQYQPILVIDQFERFQPISVEAFVAEAGLHEPHWLRFPGTWEAQYVHGPAPFGTLEFGTSPVGPAFQDEWDDPVDTIAGYRAG